MNVMIRKKKKSGRLFSNPLGFIFGNDSCRTVSLVTPSVFMDKYHNAHILNVENLFS